MSIRLTKFAEGEFYHIYNRGNSKMTIFHDDEDLERFQGLLRLSNTTERIDMRIIASNKKSSPTNELKEDKLVAIGSYCLMPNHFHILVTPVTKDGISKFMQKITTAYSMYYNKKYTHSGGLFESKFKAKHIYEDRHLKYLFAYINLNPVKLIDPTWKEKGLKNINKTFTYLGSYKYSSYLYFLYFNKDIFDQDKNNILSIKEFPNYFPTNKTFEKEIITWLTFNKK